MYYRRKIILAIIQRFGDSLSKMDLQKLLFLFNQNNNTKVFDFVPYRYGCYSFLANQDLSTMTKYNQISLVDNKWSKQDKIDYILQLKPDDRFRLLKLYNQFNSLKDKELVKYVYENYPYYAINSEIAKKILDKEKFELVSKSRPINNNSAVYTIGYEGKSIEEYVNQLIQNDVKVLCDIRKNPLSMKYGYSKNQLKGIVEKVNIKYIHIPNLGINSDKRQNLETKEDYNVLFKMYEESILQNNQDSLHILLDLLETNKRIALTCFEADYNSCHRSRTANALYKLTNTDVEFIHI